MKLETPSQPQLAEYWDHFVRIRASASELLSEISEPQLNWQASPKRWSIGQCIDHLVTTWEQYRPVVDGAIDEARTSGLESGGPFKTRWIMKRLINFLEPPPKVHLKAPDAFRPRRSEHWLEETRQSILDVQDAFMERVHAAEGLDIHRIRLASPVTKALKMHLGEFLSFMAAHERRHLWQARDIMKQSGFPKGE